MTPVRRMTIRTRIVAYAIVRLLGSFLDLQSEVMCIAATPNGLPL